MTDIELLPCPFCGGASTLTDKDSPICPVGHILCDDCYASADSARWNHRATPAKDAEVEALRAEVRDLRRRQAGWGRHIAAAGCEYVREGEHDALVNRRAERLAEALRKLVEYVQETAHHNAPAAAAARAALRDHDQEVGNG